MKYGLMEKCVNYACYDYAAFARNLEALYSEALAAGCHVR